MIQECKNVTEEPTSRKQIELTWVVGYSRNLNNERAEGTVERAHKKDDLCALRETGKTVEELHLAHYNKYTFIKTNSKKI